MRNAARERTALIPGHASAVASRSEDRRVTELAAAVFFAFLLLSAGSTWAQLPTLPDPRDFVIQLLPPPSDGAGAVETFSERAVAVVDAVACSDELNFYVAAYNTSAVVIQPDRSQYQPFPKVPGDEPGAASVSNENMTSWLIGKVDWKRLHPALIGQTWRGCKGQTDLLVDGQKPEILLAVRGATTDGGAALSSQMRAFYGAKTDHLAAGGGCDGNTDLQITATDQEDGLTGPKRVHLEFAVSAACLSRQVNVALSRMVQTGPFGSSDIPCDLLSSQIAAPNDTSFPPVTRADWDVAARELMRVLYLDQLSDFDAAITPEVHDYVAYKLVSLLTSVGPDVYPVTGCGDTEYLAGSPMDVAEQGKWQRPASQAAGNILDWLFNRLLLLLTTIGTASLAAALTGGLAGPLVAVVTVYGAQAAVAVIPETENHRLNIETTRFLRNQMLINQLGINNLGDTTVPADQEEVKVWLLSRMQEILSDDFVEYNAIPYQRYSLKSLTNLADFSADATVRVAAKMVLQYSNAKFALGSNQNRRVVPFRRRLEQVKCIVEACGVENSTGPKQELRLGPGTDHQIALGLLYNGQTQQLPMGKLSLSGAYEIIAAATSSFQPHALVSDLAIRKDASYFQRIRHVAAKTYEAYASGPIALVTAGGTVGEYSSTFGMTGLPTKFGVDNDRGAGVPTTVILSRDPATYVTPPTPLPPDISMSRMTIDSYIRFEGLRKDFDADKYTFEDNLCIWTNFACGTGMRIPGDIVRSLQHWNTTLKAFDGGGPGGWFFFDSAGTSPYTTVPRFYIVMFRACGNADCSAAAGFAEVVQVTNNLLDFHRFAAEVVGANPGMEGLAAAADGSCSAPLPSGQFADVAYTSYATNAVISFNCHQVILVNGAAQPAPETWPFAQGDVISSAGDGLVTITNPRTGAILQLDMRDKFNPCMRLGTNGQCFE